MPISEQELKARDEAKESLERMQKFDVETLPRERELGNTFNFMAAVEPARRLVRLYKQLSATVLEDFPEKQLNQIRDAANRDYTYLDEILNFTANQENPVAARQTLIDKLANAYNPTFNTLHQYISYSASKSADYQRLEGEARSMIQNVRDQADDLMQEITQQGEEAQKVLADIREVAAEEGVTQQAFYFREASEMHDTEAEAWRKRTIRLAWFLGVLIFLSLVVYKVSVLSPNNTFQSIQFAVGKILIFAVISFMLYLSARNFLAHKHNAILNKHRQNALMTYTAFVDAAKDTANKEVILMHASACIFSPQSTGYARESGVDSPSAKSVVELLAKPLTGSTE